MTTIYRGTKSLLLMNRYNKIVLNIPHSSLKIPSNEGIINNSVELDRENRCYTDLYTNEIFADKNVLEGKHIKPVIFPYSRFFCDVERFWDNNEEINSKHGQGAIYTHMYSGKFYRKVTPELSIICAKEYINHWGKLKNECSGERTLLIDCHSFNGNSNEPDICVGFNTFITGLHDEIKQMFEDLGYVVEYNNPYNGCIECNNVDNVMIEINKKLYLLDDMERKRADFYKMQIIIKKLYTELYE